LWGALYLATRDNAVTVCLPALEDVTSTEGRLVGKATSAFERILGAAMPRAGSLDLIRAAEERWKAQIRFPSDTWRRFTNQLKTCA
jgi:hypothetical protein